MEKVILKQGNFSRRYTYYDAKGGKAKEIKEIIFYNESGKVLVVEQGWLENNLNRYYNKDIEELELAQVRNARVEKFDKEDNFVIKNTLYLYVGVMGDFQLEKIEDEMQEEETSIYYYKNYIFTYNESTIKIRKFFKSKPNDFGTQVEEVEGKMRSLGISVNNYDLRTLLKNNLLNIDNLMNLEKLKA